MRETSREWQRTCFGWLENRNSPQSWARRQGTMSKVTFQRNAASAVSLRSSSPAYQITMSNLSLTFGSQKQVVPAPVEADGKEAHPQVSKNRSADEGQYDLPSPL